MFTHAKSILFILLIEMIVCDLVQNTLESQTFANHSNFESIIKQNCKCFNNGQCYSLIAEQLITDQKKQVYCHCPNTFIGQNCKYQAYELSTIKQISQKVNTYEYKYFYYQPNEENMYSFSFDLCFDTKYLSKPGDQKFSNDQITLFITSENENGGFQTEEQITGATTITIQQDECKQITIDYTVLLITKLKTIQKLIIGIKLGEKINLNSSKTDNQLELEKQKIRDANKQIKRDIETNEAGLTKRTIGKLNQTNQSQIQKLAQTQNLFADYHPILFSVYSKKKQSISNQEDTAKKQSSKTINEFKSKSPSKLKQNDDLYPSKLISITFTVYPFMVEFVVFNIIFSLTALVAFLIVGVMIFLIRSRILGITITSSLGISSRLINDLSHFDRYIPSQKFIKKQRKEGDMSPNSSQIQCAICLVKFQQMELIRRTPCSHSFHKSCIDAWCHENLTCPMCRKSLTQKNMIQFFNSTALELKNSPESDE